MPDHRSPDKRSPPTVSDDPCEFARLLERTRETLEHTRELVASAGHPEDQTCLEELGAALEHLATRGDLELLRRHAGDVNVLRFRVLDRLPAFHVHAFDSLSTHQDDMTDPYRAHVLIAQGRRAVDQEDLAELKVINRHLLALLPPYAISNLLDLFL